jgi:hypothetical protein
MNRWWDGQPGEDFWLETTDRPDLGVDLKAPQVNDAGHVDPGYTGIREVADGDVIFHYHLPSSAIVAWSRAIGVLGTFGPLASSIGFVVEWHPAATGR